MKTFASVRSSPLRRHAARILAAAKRRKLTIVTAESCTAGQLVSLLATLPAAAETLEGGFIAYSKRGKTAALGVPRSLIARHTPVSREVAVAMAKGALKRSHATVAIAVTGVAGPTRDEDGNPVGLVYVAAARRGRHPACRKARLRHKDPNRNLAAIHRLALAMLGAAVAAAAKHRPKGHAARSD